MTYEKHGDGFIADLARSRAWHDREATIRLNEHRAASSGTMAGFTTPEYVAKDFAIGLSPAAAYTNQCSKLPDPGFGLQINIPTLTTAPTFVSNTTENSTAISTAPAGAGRQAVIQTVRAEFEVSQQMLDRMDPAAEAVFNQTLSSALYAGVEQYVLTTVIAGANAIAGSGTAPLTTQAFLNDVGDAVAVANSATNVTPTAFVASGPQLQWLLALQSASGQSLFMPFPTGQYTEEQVGETGQEPTGAAGYRLGMLHTFFSNEMPTAAAGAQEQILVSTPQDVMVSCSDVNFEVIPTPGVDSNSLGANTLTALVRAYVYVGAVVRRPLAHSVITGAGYPHPVVFNL